MSANVFNQVAFLRTSREFPEEIHQLTVEINKSYLTIAEAVNKRTIGIFSTNKPAITGNSWFLKNQKQQTLRQVFAVTSTTSVNHNIKGLQPGQVIFAFGSYTEGTNSYGLIFGTSGAIPNQISFYVTSTQIVFVIGAGAPALTSGKVVLEWLSAI